jgi:hypothetical protein
VDESGAARSAVLLDIRSRHFVFRKPKGPSY